MFLLQPPEVRTLDVFTMLPARFRQRRRTVWSDANMGGREVDAFLEGPVFEGRTLVLVDVSGSMGARLSARSDLTRMDAAATLASIIPGDVRVFTFSNDVKEVPPRRGMAGVDAVIRSQPHGGTWLGKAVGKMNAIGHDRLIVITDEQSHDPVPAPVASKAYMVNVASARNAIGHGDWTRIDGFSEAILTYIREHEMFAGGLTFIREHERFAAGSKEG